MGRDIKKACPICGSKSLRSVFDIYEVPIYCNVLWDTKTQALAAAKGDISLAFCSDCGHFFNAAFDPLQVDYTANYENSLHFSPRFNEYAQGLADRLVKTYDLHDKDLIEIGCGKGDFLTLLCEKGNNRGIGFDRSYEPDRGEQAVKANITFIQDFYGERYSDYPADFVCCRHVLEHIDGPVEFLRGLREWLGDRPDTVVYFEVPDALFTIRSLGIWDLIYEHCSYFTRRSLARAFQLAGFEVLALGESFGGQYLYIEVKPCENPEVPIFEDGLDMHELTQHIDAFDASYREKVETWRDRLRADGDRTVIWGGGSKGVTFLNVLQGAGVIEFAVDLNPYKHGKYLPGTGQKVIPPEALPGYAPHRVIVMNPLYSDEISKSLQELDVRTEVVCV